ncbi:MAG: cohesin domain-containing protein [bacterium]
MIRLMLTGYSNWITRFSIISLVVFDIFLVGVTVQAQVATETPYDFAEMRRKARYDTVAPSEKDTQPVPGPRPSGPPVPPARPVPSPRPAPALTPTPTPVPAPTPAMPSIVRGSGSNIGSVTLLFDPLSARIKQGALFAQDIVINNPRGTGYDLAEVMIKYNPECLAVKDIVSKIVPAKYPAAKVIVNEIDEKKGIIRFGIENKTGNFYYSGAIATINWYAKKKAFGSRVTYIFVSDASKGTTVISTQNRDILGASGDPTDGVVSATISVE